MHQQRAREPEDPGRLFVEHANRGDAEGLAALYEPGAVLADIDRSVCYGDVMAAVRITLSVPENLADRIKKAAGEGTVSGWVVKVIEEYFAEDAELERQFDEWLEANPPSEEAQNWVDEVMEKALGIHRREDGAA